jgi:hypothetical protein
MSPIGPPYGLDGIELAGGLTPAEMGERLAFLPDEVAGLPRGGATSDRTGATVVYVDQSDSNAPRFGVVVALLVEPSDDADRFVATLERERWGDPADHDLTAAGDGSGGQPAFREFSRTFPPTQFALPYRPVYFLLWYRAGDDYAFMIVAGSADARAALARAVASALG